MIGLPLRALAPRTANAFVLPPRRRIFRSALLPVPRPYLFGRVLAGVLLACGLIVLYLRASALISEAPAAVGHPEPQHAVQQLSVPAGQAAVVDGATLRIGDRVVTLLGVDAPPRGQTCQAGAETVDCGAAAAAALARLVRDRVVDCQLFGEDRSGREQAICQAAGTELNRAQLADGWARPAR